MNSTVKTQDILKQWSTGLLWWNHCSSKGKSTYCHVPGLHLGLWHSPLLQSCLSVGELKIWWMNTWKDKEMRGCHVQRAGVKGSMSKWRPVTRDVPQGSVLGEIVFNILINYIDNEVRCTLNKFVDNMKISVGFAWEKECFPEALWGMEDWDRVPHNEVLQG